MKRLLQLSKRVTTGTEDGEVLEGRDIRPLIWKRLGWGVGISWA